MAKRRNKGRGAAKGGSQRGSRQSRQPGSRQSTRAEPKTLEQEIKTEHHKAMAVAEQEGLVVPTTADPKPEGVDIEALWAMVSQARDAFAGAQTSYESRRQELDARSAALDEQERLLAARSEKLDARAGELKQYGVALDERAVGVTEREQGLETREMEVREREINAERGFTKQRQEMLSQVEELRDDLRSEFDQRRQDNEARFKKQEEALNGRETALAAERRKLNELKLRFEYEEEELADLRADVERRADQLAAGKSEKLEHEIRSLEAQLKQARHDRDRYEGMLREREHADRSFGHRGPEEVLKELTTRSAEIQQLRAELAERPDADAADRLTDLEQEREAWQTERVELRRKLSEARRRLALVDMDATERESQRDVIESLNTQRKWLQKAHSELRATVEELYDRSEARTPFPACTAMDQDVRLRSEQPLETGALDLAAFVADLQQRIATSEPALFYSLQDLRSFVGGIAMGRLIILQGMSGTGKTSLPVRFAHAVGTQASAIKVQAGWRDPQDLVGHYNTFEKRFHETEFLKAVYRAGTPLLKDTMQIVLLDEMNLSHPEQYFSDLLATLEFAEDERRLELMSHSAPAAPALLEDGCRLRIPSNVWFVGTANHDETTMGFADKTYDRAHVMEFSARPDQFEVGPLPPRPPLSFKALKRAFDAAIKRHRDCAETAVEFLESNVHEILVRDFQISWGPRLTRQMEHYVPVVVAAGGTTGEATDHTLAMRLLRKLRNRHANRPERVEALKRRILESWAAIDADSEPTKSMELLDSELRRLGREPENHG